MARKPIKRAAQVARDARVEIAGEALRYASRAGLKLEGALEDFSLSPLDCVCMDIGSSTGGFTDCLLQNGAAKVYAVDVTIDQLDWKLRQIQARGDGREKRALPASRRISVSRRSSSPWMCRLSR